MTPEWNPELFKSRPAVGETPTAAEGFYRAIVEEMPQGAVILSDEGIITFANRFFASLVNAPRNMLVGRAPLNSWRRTARRSGRNGFPRARSRRVVKRSRFRRPTAP